MNAPIVAPCRAEAMSIDVCPPTFRISSTVPALRMTCGPMRKRTEMRSASSPHSGRRLTEATANAVALSAATGAVNPLSWK